MGHDRRKSSARLHNLELSCSLADVRERSDEPDEIIAGALALGDAANRETDLCVGHQPPPAGRIRRRTQNPC